MVVEYEISQQKAVCAQQVITSISRPLLRRCLAVLRCTATIAGGMVRRASYSRTPAQSPGRMSPFRRPTTSSTCPCRPPHPRGATARLPACPAASSRSRSSLPAFSRGRLALVRALRRRSASTMTPIEAAPRHGVCPMVRPSLAHASMPSHDHA